MTKFASANDRGFMRTMAVMVRWMAEIKEVKIEADSQQQKPGRTIASAQETHEG